MHPRSPEISSAELHQVLIIGAGPAGISCALELHEARVDYLLLERNSRLGGQLADIKNTIRNFAARYWESGADLRDDMESLCRRIGINMRVGQLVDSVNLADKQITVGDHVYGGLKIFLATGSRLRRLEVEGADEFSERIIYDVETNEHLMTGKTIAIVGGGDNALMDAAWLARRGCHVHLVHRSDLFRARPDVINDALSQPDVIVHSNCAIKKVSGGYEQPLTIFIEDAAMRQLKNISADYIVVKIGYAPNSELFRQQLIADKDGFIITDQMGRTSLEGIFAGGDLVAPSMFSIAKSVGHGVVAARTIAGALAGSKTP